ncbi:ParA family protein [Polaromonas sp. YR568]|uniref:ParA family protein n=1 Tax=Polaromonas sp. YR568 TaxID=1855301 RepID=UPI003137A4D1
MPVIAVVNRKGGSGKSTLAAHVAAWCARNGSSVMLGDVDRQQSARSWLKRRDPALPAIAPWAVDQKNMLRVPTGITHVVLDTPGGMHGFELARVVMFADAILMPVCHSMFDRESAAACHADLMALPRVASGRCRLATIGMRIDARTNAAETLRQWSEDLKLPFLGVLRETQLYVRSLERGMTIFDLPGNAVAADLEQWQPILDWLRPTLYAPQAANDSAAHGAAAAGAMTGIVSAHPAPLASSPAQNGPRVLGGRPLREQTLPAAAPTRLGSSLPGSLMPAQESLVHGARLSARSTARAVSQPVQASSAPTLSRNVNLPDGLQIPQFLKRQTGS